MTTKASNIIKSLSALVVTAVMGLIPAQAAAEGLKLCDRPWASPADMFEKLSKTEKLPEVHRDKYYVAYQDPKATTMWTFTLAGIPAHPAVVCRQPVKEGEMMRLHMDVNCDGDERACDELVKDFRRLNSEMAKAMNKRQP